MPQGLERTVLVLRVDGKPLGKQEEGHILEVSRLCHGAQDVEQVALAASQARQGHAYTLSSL